MPRSSWKGYLKLSLVSCAVALYNASSASDRVSFNKLNRKTGNRLKQNMVDSVTGEPVDTADRVKGYQVSKGQYVMVEDDEIEALKLESTRTIEIETFVPASEIDEIYIDSPYYLAPDDKVAEEAFAVIREAMTRKKMVGIGRIVLARRERMLMLQPRDKGMLATTCAIPTRCARAARSSTRSATQAAGRDARHRPGDHQPHDGSLEPDTFSDRYEEAVVGMLRAKQQGQTFSVPEPSQPANVVNIMDALKKSLRGRGRRRCRAPAARAQQDGGRRSGRRQGRRRANRWRRTPRRAKRRAGSGATVPLGHHQLRGETLFLVGRIQGLTRRRLDTLVRLREAKLATRPGRTVTTIAFGHLAVARALDDGRVALPPGMPTAAVLISENVLRRELGLLAPPVGDRPQHGPRRDRAAERALGPTSCPAWCCSTCSSRSMKRFAWGDLVAAREAARLLKQGVAIGDVLEASVALRRGGGNLAEARLTEGSDGRASAPGRAASWPSSRASSRCSASKTSRSRAASTIFSARPRRPRPWAITPRPRASTPRRCAPTPPTPCCPSTSATSSRRKGRGPEAKVAWQIAVARDPAFAEAWYNLALAAEDEEQTDLAIAEYRRAVKAQPDWGDAHFNLALLLTQGRALRRGAGGMAALPRGRAVRASTPPLRRRRSRSAA